MKTLEYALLTGVQIFVGVEGAEIRALDQDGNVQWQIGLMPGKEPAEAYRPMMQPEWVLEAVGAASFVRMATGRTTRISHPNARDSGANPDWTPARESDEAKMLRKMILDVSRKNAAVEQRMRLMEQAKAAPVLVEPDPVPVAGPAPVEPEPVPGES